MDIGIEISRDEKGFIVLLVGGRALPNIGKYVCGPAESDGMRHLRPGVVGYEVRHRIIEGVFELDVTMNLARSSLKTDPLSVDGFEFLSAVGYRVRNITEQMVELTVTLCANSFRADIKAREGFLLGC